MSACRYRLVAIEGLFFQLLEAFFFHLLHEGARLHFFFFDLFFFHCSGAKSLATERFLLRLVLLFFLTMFFLTIWRGAGRGCHTRLVLGCVQENASGGVDQLVVRITVVLRWAVRKLRCSVAKFFWSERIGGGFHLFRCLLLLPL